MTPREFTLALNLYNTGVEAARREYDEDPFAAARHRELAVLHSQRARGVITRAEYEQGVSEVASW